MRIGRIAQLTGVAFCLAGAGGVASMAGRAEVKCPAAAAYRGPALRAAVVLPQVTGALQGTVDADVAERLTQAVTKARNATNAASMTVAVALPDGALWATEMGGGANNGDASAAASKPLHYWASSGKTFVAVVVMQLVEEGKLALSDPVSRWLPGVPNGEVITIEHLLAHASGLFSANEDLKVREKRRYYTPLENLATAKKHGPMFCPGEMWRYSNTGYDLLGMVIERVDGRPFNAAIDARIIAPLGLKRLRALTPGRPPSDIALLVSTKERPIDPSWPGAAGAIAGSADDMVRFWHALLGHRLLKPETLRRMTERLYPMFTPVEFYGLGVMVFDVPDADGSKTTWIGHAGGTPGAGAIVAYSLADRTLSRGRAHRRWLGSRDREPDPARTARRPERAAALMAFEASAAAPEARIGF